MKWHRIWAIIIRHLKTMQRDFNRLSGLLYWSLFDITIIGFTAFWLTQNGSISESIKNSIIAGTALWQIIVRANLDISVALLEEILSHNMNNLFATPLTIIEWITANTLVAFIFSMFIVVYAGIFVWIFYAFSLLKFGWLLIPLFFVLLFSGISMGFLAASILVYWGARIQTIVWMMGFMFAPLSGISYDISILPFYLQFFSRMLPMSYIFEVMRMYLMHHVIAWDLLGKSFILVLVYLCITLGLFLIMFEKSKEKGLARLVD